MDRLKRQMVLDHALVPAGETIRIPVQAPVQLSNSGGLITLLDPDGLKVDGVAYTKDEAGHKGATLVF
jgi:hypothetical protein